jgi:hypothetical protein
VPGRQLVRLFIRIGGSEMNRTGAFADPAAAVIYIASS